MEGSLDYLFRSFSLWIVSCNASRRFALQVAIENKLNEAVQIGDLPQEIVRGMQLDSAYEARNRILDFIRRYRGPTGNEPNLADDEIELVMLATYSQRTPTRNAG